MNVQHRTLNVQLPIRYSISLNRYIKQSGSFIRKFCFTLHKMDKSAAPSILDVGSWTLDVRRSIRLQLLNGER